MTAPGGYQPLKPSILDRIAGRLFPTAQQFDPAVARQGLLQLGAGLLQAGGPQAQQQGTLANIGAAIGGVDVNALTKQALMLRAYQQQQAVEQKVGEVAARHAPKPGETPQQIYDRIAAMVGELAGSPGTEDLIGKLSNVLAQLRPARDIRARYKFETVVENGVPVRYRVNIDDPSDRIQIGMAYTPAAMGVPTDAERRAGALYTVGENAYQTLQADFGSPTFQDWLASKVPFGLGQPAISDTQQARNVAGADFYRSYLYIVSGATVNDKEAAEQSKIIIPQLGDSPATVQQKLRDLDVKVRAMRAVMGRAAKYQQPQQPVAPVPDGNFDDFLTPRRP